MVVGVTVFAWAPVAALQRSPLDPDTESYLALVAEYREGRHVEAVADLRGWAPELIQRVARGLPEQLVLRVCKERPDQVAYGMLDAAVLLHTDVALAAWREDRGVEAALHLDHAQRTLEWLSRQAVVLERRKLSDVARQCGEPPPLAQRDWLLAVTKLCVREWALGLADQLARRLLEIAPDDPDALFAAGTVWDGMATNDAQYYQPPPSWRLSDSEWREAQRRYQQALRDIERFREEAARLYERALAASPDRHDIRLRLGWVSVHLGRERAGRTALEGVVSNAGALPDRYLAALFLGRLSQKEDRFDEAVTWYERASGLMPFGHVARIGLARALEQRGDIPGAVAALERAIDPAEPPSDDPWLAYPYADWEAGMALLNRLRSQVTRR